MGTPSSDAGAAAGDPGDRARGDRRHAAGGRRDADAGDAHVEFQGAVLARSKDVDGAESSESDSARRLRARRTESPERRDVARSEAVIEALDMGSPTRPARRSANRER